jgi:hypothetical protein
VPISRVAIGRVATTGLLSVALASSLAACGFIAAGNKSGTKPSGFVLTGQAAVALPASDAAAVGSPCQAPTGATDVTQNVLVTVTDDSGGKIATGRLGAGVITGSGASLTCSFPFEIGSVGGNSETYGVAIGSRPAQKFDGAQLRQSSLAVVKITP